MATGGAFSAIADDEYVTSHMPVREVHIDALAVMRLAKHCHDSLPARVTGCLIGLDNDGVLEITYAFPYPSKTAEVSEGQEGAPVVTERDVDGEEYKLEMMKMLRDVNVDNNSVGWYQSVYMGNMMTKDVVASLFRYQSSLEMSENSVMIAYDPIQSNRSSLVLKAYRLTEEYIALRKVHSNDFIAPANIFEELPVIVTSSGHSAAYLRCVQDTYPHDLTADLTPLTSTSSEVMSERNLELIRGSLEEALDVQQQFQVYVKTNSKSRMEHIRWLARRMQENAERRENGEEELPLTFDQSGVKAMGPAPSRTSLLLSLSQLEKYSSQLNSHIDTQFQKLSVSSQFHL